MRRMARTYVMLDNTDIVIEEEYTLQDFSAIVATLGGSVGIFLGWSLLDGSRMLASLMKRMI